MTRRERPRRQATVAGRRPRHREQRARAGRGPWSDGRRDGEITVQLLATDLAAGELPPAAVGDEIEVAPAIYAGFHLPAPPGRDRWHVDELGLVEARGAVLTAPVDPGACECGVDVLDVAGGLFPLNWAATARAEGRLRIDGALYLDPQLAPGSDYGDAVDLCRRRYRIGAIRRYRRTVARPDMPADLPAVPSPGEVTEAAVYVADLRPVPELGPDSGP